MRLPRKSIKTYKDQYIIPVVLKIASEGWLDCVLYLMRTNEKDTLLLSVCLTLLTRKKGRKKREGGKEGRKKEGKKKKICGFK